MITRANSSRKPLESSCLTVVVGKGGAVGLLDDQVSAGVVDDLGNNTEIKRAQYKVVPVVP